MKEKWSEKDSFRFLKWKEIKILLCFSWHKLICFKRKRHHRWKSLTHNGKLLRKRRTYLEWEYLQNISVQSQWKIKIRVVLQAQKWHIKTKYQLASLACRNHEDLPSVRLVSFSRLCLIDDARPWKRNLFVLKIL